MNAQFHLYISAATDLEPERELLGRVVTEIPIDLGWRIIQSPRRSEPLDLEAILQADAHLLLLGGDIRAPIGLEWFNARRAGRLPVLFLKEGLNRTPAALNFVRFIASQASWQPFKEEAQLRRLALILLSGLLLDQGRHFNLSQAEIELLQNWRSDLDRPAVAEFGDRQAGTGDSGVILSLERYMPSKGILLEQEQKKAQTPGE